MAHTGAPATTAATTAATTTTSRPATSSAATGCNLVVLRGHLSADPRQRVLPSGDVLTSFDVTTRDADGAASVPVSARLAVPALAAGDEVVVVGSVRRRFFRAGGVTQSRTEVVADHVVKGGRPRSIARAVAKAVDRLADRFGTG